MCTVIMEGKMPVNCGSCKMLGHAGTHARVTVWPEGHTGCQRCVWRIKKERIGESRSVRHMVWPQKEPNAQVNACTVIRRCWVWWQGTGG